ncbi:MULTISPECIES: hypothetical protein [Rhizobium]|uniref:Uncharacterized protein n=1 Tax=Rhizobium indicum TaxID=2583231 RepID=A0ABX6PRJ5_9HYPH|nr:MULTISPECIES: hypothetical protein [Rhizobium]MBB4345623.1 hypothetical protein [Rhizobium leguminosarum]MBB5262344.1 hypothetical protein [Rhizobium leguminosarum]MBB6298695.1 hypothetical protein [Rhizobium leguminosarum]MBY5345591.1 hypothetical protein [Rhizobium leguminosarum]MDX5999857.1 hypothetical protein [Rhizobium leguminosarum]
MITSTSGGQVPNMRETRSSASSVIVGVSLTGRLVDRILTIALWANLGSVRLPFHLALLHHQPKAGVSLGGSNNSFEMTTF